MKSSRKHSLPAPVALAALIALTADSALANDTFAGLPPIPNVKTDTELHRWTTEDPSSFPNGPIASFHAPVPTSALDWMGLPTWKIKKLSGDDYKSVITGIHSGLVHDYVWKLALKTEATTSSVGIYVMAEVDKYLKTGGGILSSESALSMRTGISIGVSSDGYLTGAFPLGDVVTDGRVSSGYAVTATGFDGNSRIGTVTIDLIAVYDGTVTFNSSTKVLSFGGTSPNMKSHSATVSFQYQAYE